MRASDAILHFGVPTACSRARLRQDLFVLNDCIPRRDRKGALCASGLFRA
jgi:hypothetical protein